MPGGLTGTVSDVVRGGRGPDVTFYHFPGDAAALLGWGQSCSTTALQEQRPLWETGFSVTASSLAANGSLEVRFLALQHLCLLLLTTPWFPFEDLGFLHS